MKRIARFAAALWGAAGFVKTSPLRVFAAPYAMIALALGLAIAPAGCVTQAQQDAFNANLIATTQNLVALNDALVKVNKTLIDDAMAQAKLLAPYQCGAYKLGAAIIEGSPAAAKVNAVIKTDVAAGLANASVKGFCAALGYPTDVSAPADTPTVAAPAS
jgi:hypothetical protein